MFVQIRRGGGVWRLSGVCGFAGARLTRIWALLMARQSPVPPDYSIECWEGAFAAGRVLRARLVRSPNLCSLDGEDERKHPSTPCNAAYTFVTER